MANDQPRECNKIYEALTEKPGDILGLLAYGIYKREKIDHIKRFFEANQKNPSDEDLRMFHAESMARIEQYRKLATSEVQELYNHIAVEQGEMLYTQMTVNLEETLKGLKARWWFGVWQGAVGSLVFTICLFVLLMLAIGFFEGAPAIVNTLTKWLLKLGPPSVP